MSGFPLAVGGRRVDQLLDRSPARLLIGGVRIELRQFVLVLDFADERLEHFDQRKRGQTPFGRTPSGVSRKWV